MTSPPGAPFRRRWMRRLATVSLGVAAGSAALALAGPYALAPFVDAAGAATEVGVAFVLDFGGARGQVVGCVHVPASDNGYYALAAFTEQEHLAAPTYNASGLLCSIGGIPASGCGEPAGGAYIFWAYFLGGTGTWMYANRGASAPVTPGDVEGWRFEDPGPDNPKAPKPRTAPDYASICEPSTTTTTSTPTQTTTPTFAAPTSTTGPTTTTAPSGHGAPAASTATTILPSNAVVTTTAPPAGSGPRRAPATGTVPATAEHTSTSTSAPGSSGGHTEALGSTPASAHPAGGSGTTPLIVGGILVAALAVASVLRWRRRPRMR